MIHDWAERGAYLFAAAAVVSLSQAALWASLFAALVSIILGGFKLHDRLKYGPGK
jgi:hypothetical protein